MIGWLLGILTLPYLRSEMVARPAILTTFSGVATTSPASQRQPECNVRNADNGSQVRGRQHDPPDYPRDNSGCLRLFMHHAAIQPMEPPRFRGRDIPRYPRPTRSRLVHAL